MKLTLRYMRNQADAEDTVQDIFLRAYGGLRHFRGDSAFYSWLHRIAVNSAKSAHKMRVRNARRLSVRADPGDDPAEVSPQTKDWDSPEHLAMTDEICAAVNDAIDALCEEQRTAISLREFDGLSYAEVASAMSCPVGTVRSRVFRARQAIDFQLRRVFDDGLGRARNKSVHKASRAAFGGSGIRGSKSRMTGTPLAGRDARQESRSALFRESSAGRYPRGRRGQERLAQSRAHTKIQGST